MVTHLYFAWKHFADLLRLSCSKHHKIVFCLNFCSSLSFSGDGSSKAVIPPGTPYLMHTLSDLDMLLTFSSTKREVCGLLRLEQ